MTPYIIILIYCIFGILYFDLKKRTHYKLVFFIGLAITMTLVIGLRYRVGGDTWAYMGDYQLRVPLKDWKFTFIDRFQPGYSFLCAIGKSISDEFYVFQLIHATILNTCLFYFIWKNSRYIFTAISALFISYYLYYSTEVLREILAVMVFILNYKAFNENRWTKYYIGVTLACLFHISAIFLAVLPILRKIKCDKSFIIVYLSAAFFFLFTKTILSSLSSVVLLSKINTYINQETHGLLADIIALVENSIFPLCFCIIAKYYSKKSIQFERMILILSIFGLGSFFNPIIFGRATNYFMIFFIVSISQFIIQCVLTQKKILHQYALVMTLAFLLIYGGENLMYGKYTRWIPYYSIFNPVDLVRDNYNN